ncbi:MAG: ribonuclease HII [bacterium]|nr:ribonuclease HII [bacterium]
MSLVHLGVESFRLRMVAGLESELGCAGYQRIAGVDEAGRGCLAGPVVAAAVIPHPESLIPGVTDSKLLNPAKRELLAAQIRETALSWSVEPVAAEVIDRINILEATKQAMRRALTSLRPRPEVALVDAVPLRVPGLRCLPLVRGDYISYAIAAASILAKVSRDRIMTELDAKYPHYGFATHKGYAAPRHLEALRKYGPSCHHRLTFHSVLPSAIRDDGGDSERAHGS